MVAGGGAASVVCMNPLLHFLSYPPPMQPPAPPRPPPRRRSTDTSPGLDYYWSSLAGAGPSSSSSSLALSPSPSLVLALADRPSPASLSSYGTDSGSSGSHYAPTEYTTPNVRSDENGGDAQGDENGSHAQGHENGSHAQEDEEAGLHRRDVRSSAASGATYVPTLQQENAHASPMEPDTEEFKTPIAVPWQERPDLVPPQFVFPVSSSSPGGQFKSPGSAQRAQTIPVAASIYTPTNPSASSPRAHTPQSTVSAHPVLERGPGGTPRSAPAHTSAFGTGADGKEDGWEETLKGRNRRTLPAKVPSSASNLAGLLDGSIDEPGAEQHTYVFHLDETIY